MTEISKSHRHRKATIHDVARVAGVSIKTVSRVLNKEPNVKAVTREKVFAAVATLAYSPNISARSLASDRSYLIGLVYDNASPGYLSDIQLGALERCRAEGYHLIVEQADCTAADVATRLVEFARASRLDGIILTPPASDHQAVIAGLAEAGVTTVRIAPDRKAGPAPYVAIDEFQAGFDMTRHLLALGHRQIGFVKGHPGHGAARARYDGFCTALAAAGVTLDRDFVTQGDFSYKSGLDAAERLLNQAKRPTAIFAANDDMAAGVCATAHKLGIDIPGDLSVAGFDDTPVATVIWPQLTTIRQPISAMAAAAVELLIDAIAVAGKTPAGSEVAHRDLDFTLVARASTAAPRRT